jgi:protocatechuate 4,5-dioxygenase beta chain
MAADFDVARLQELSLDHTIIAPLTFLAPDVDVPIVPVYVNVFLRPLPSAARCLGFGRALGAAIAAAPADRRVAVAGSGSFSLEIGGPRIAETGHVGVPDAAWMDRVLELVGAGDVEALVAEATDEQLWRAGNAGGETLDWIVAMGAIEAMGGLRRPDYVAAQPRFGHGFAAWKLAGAGAGAGAAARAEAEAA